ncbi:MAG: hypothetical protein IK052_05545 [Bacteroidales bacterium]|nr:hypothetical protein [Bacteroidales bacterium]
MKALSTFLSLVLISCITANAASTDDRDKSNTPFKPSFSLEVGGGLAPIHLLLSAWNLRRGSGETEKYAAEGKSVTIRQRVQPGVFFSLAYRPVQRWEFTVTAGFSWINAHVVQHPEFGILPNGMPRYNSSAIESEYPMIIPSFSVTPQARRYWNPKWKVQVYTAFGIGFYGPASYQKSNIQAIPSFTPFGFKYAKGRFYFFLENGFTPFSTLLFGGVGVRL